eukprot:CAMPEP_0185729464 /NCGR_PEP_ID=MMETSP1171-20130828/5912_1 /TAXON_ID=374046 /ORGANISM="Helicotheca tamensis, Strain CCMP826" /LENGTH=297 /DNA_ID=CAMNT_0028398309 /DNA_START=253 /DNA_END=1146 /DNA_ORIENTATION=+
MVPNLPGTALYYAGGRGPMAPGDVHLDVIGNIWHPEHPNGAALNHFSDFGPLPHQGGEPCQICSRPMIGTCMESYWGDRYCPEHEHELEKCYCCGRPVCDTLTGGGVRYHDGRTVCNICMNEGSPVDTEEEAQSILYNVCADLTNLGFDFGSMEEMPPLRLVDAETTGGVDGTSILSTRKFLGREVSRSTEIHVLHSLPRTHMGSVLAHELGHVYIHRLGYPELPEQVEEGLCELMACTWLATQVGDPYAEYHYQLKVTNDCPVYGEGLRNALDAVRGNHEDAVELFKFVREHGHFP